MLTNSLQKIKNDIQSKRVLSYSDTELLEILNHMDAVEDRISSGQALTDPPSFKSEVILEMLIMPEGKGCSICGRKLK